MISSGKGGKNVFVLVEYLDWEVVSGPNIMGTALLIIRKLTLEVRGCPYIL